jgi:hypothetical protein
MTSFTYLFRFGGPMRIKMFAFIWFAALAVAPITLTADEGCCDKPAMACCDQAAPAADTAAKDCCQKATTHNHSGAMDCCKDGGCDMPCCKDGGECDMPCCQGTGEDIEPNAIDVLLAMDGQAILPMIRITPARQTAEVFFQRPVWVGRTVLMGKYVIEHDTDRQARGEPCTHIYAADNDKTPVVTFHCTHLEATQSDKAVVVLQSLGDGQQRFVQFQFSGETAAHGYPAAR